jgi:hypothetical protein
MLRHMFVQRYRTAKCSISGRLCAGASVAVMPTRKHKRGTLVKRANIGSPGRCCPAAAGSALLAAVADEEATQDALRHPGGRRRASGVISFGCHNRVAPGAAIARRNRQAIAPDRTVAG